jgi:hypothetical protein
MCVCVEREREREKERERETERERERERRERERERESTISLLESCATFLVLVTQSTRQTIKANASATPGLGFRV